MRHEALPDARDDELGRRRGQPAIERGNDVRIGVRGDQVEELLRLEVARAGRQQFVEGQVAARVDDGAMVVVHDQELVGLDGISDLFHQVREHETDMVRVPIKFDGHAAPFRMTRRD